MREEVEECQELTSLTSMHSQLSSDIDAVCMDLQQSLHDGDLKVVFVVYTESVVQAI